MKRTEAAAVVVILVMVALLAHAAPPLFPAASESQWTVSSGGAQVATIALLTDGKSVRAEWKSGQVPVVFVGTDSKVWVKRSGGDVELASHDGGIESLIAPALLLPYTASTSSKTELSGGRTSIYTYPGAKASYKYDGNAPLSVEIAAGGKTYLVTRTGLKKPASVDASLYTVRPKTTATSQISRLAGNLLGPSDRKVSATAGGRGVKPVTKLADGGDYDALQQLEERDAAWKESMGEALLEFQQSGRVGGSREGSR
ncbi:MAG TPA: hypothetical protein VM557_13540 [Thermoanaerobaculia bacterium]|nr:hypothetical protein [Thermoanaerobaculia bacterium]